MHLLTNNSAVSFLLASDVHYWYKYMMTKDSIILCLLCLCNKQKHWCVLRLHYNACVIIILQISYPIACGTFFWPKFCRFLLDYKSHTYSNCMSPQHLIYSGLLRLKHYYWILIQNKNSYNSYIFWTQFVLLLKFNNFDTTTPLQYFLTQILHWHTIWKFQPSFS